MITLRTKLLALLLFLLTDTVVYGQRARLFSTDSEISNSLVYDIVQDQKGIIWVATEDGLNQFNGSKIKIYREDPQREGAILNNFVRDIFEDKSGNLFFGFFNGLQLYHREEDRFYPIPLLLEHNSPCPAHVLTMTERRNGDILIGSSGFGVFLLGEEDGKLKGRRINNLVPSNFINFLFEDNQENLWISTQDKGLFMIGPQGGEPVQFPSTGNDISSICQDKQGHLFVGSLSAGLFKFNFSNQTFENAGTWGKEKMPVKVLFPSEDHELIIGTDGKGAVVFNTTENTFSDLNFNVSNFDLSQAKIHAITKDQAGNIWLGVFQKGVVLIPSYINNFQYIGYQSVKNNIIGSSYVASVFIDRKGMLWVGTDGGGIYRIARETSPIPQFFPTQPLQSAPGNVMCIFQDHQDDIWIGSYFDGLAKLNRKTNQFEYIRNFVNENGIPITRVTDIIQDDQKTLWISTLGFGIYAYNLSNNSIIHYNGRPNAYHVNDAVNAMHNNWINCIMVSADNKIYLGTVDGISVFDKSAKIFTPLNDLFPLLSGKFIHTFYENDEGGIWIGSSEGLFYLNPARTDLRAFHTRDGLPSNIICSIQEDAQRQLWISTNYGISRLDPNTLEFTNFFYHDGLQGNEFSKRASSIDQDGTLFFGGINGITYFNPAKIKHETQTLQVVITDFYIQDTAVRKGRKSGKYNIIDTSVMEASTFHLAHHDNTFSIEFSSFEYVNPKRISYQYAMNDNHWVDLQQGINLVTFNDLEPGEYTFRVKAKDYTTISEIKTIHIIINPPWYFSGWAKASYFLFGSLVLFGIYSFIMQRYETRKKLREHLHAEQINKAKLEFFTNISHEIKTPLSLILNPLLKIKNTDPDPARQKAYKTIQRNTEKILHLINQLMDLRKMDRGKISLKFKETDLVDFITQASEMFEEQIQSKNIAFQLHAESNIHKVWIDPEYFDKSIQNILSNALKFTPEGGSIQVFIANMPAPAGASPDADRVCITIKDSGIGLKESEMDKIFDRFYQSGHGKDLSKYGTGIGLHLSRSMVELHYGTIRAENNTDGPGAKFMICLPVGHSHLDANDLIVDPAAPKALPADLLPEPLPLAPQAEEAPVKSKSKRWVLVVDDDVEIRKYICQELAPEYHMAESANGKEALTWVLHKKPDLVISDVMMPEMDGKTLCKKIKQNISINHIPVVLLTAKSGEKDNLEGLGLGADAYIAKPFNMELLKKTVENLIKNRELLKNNYSGNQTQDDKITNIALQSADEKLIEKVVKTINLNISNPQLDVETIAREIGISRVHLYRKLKELTNQSARELIRNIRLKQAGDLLTQKNLSIAEVAYATGFSNPSKFSTSFKEFYGMPPKEYIEAHAKPDHANT
jgi:signal transduction histidine kinase/ligand-binding sensor domain-containing protein/DNA-binding response OmpR family regulator